MAQSSGTSKQNEVRTRGETPLEAGPSPLVTLYGTLVDASCRDRTALNLAQKPESFNAAAPPQTAQQAQTGASQRAQQGYANPQNPAQQPNASVSASGINVDAKTLQAERSDVLEHQVPDLRSRQMDPTCAVTGYTHAFAVLLNNGRLVRLDEGGNTFATEAVQGHPAGREMMSGAGGGLKPNVVIKGRIHADQVIVETLKLQK
jgi:hypothetical protein